MGRDHSFRLKAKAREKLFSRVRNKGLTETGNRARKVSGTQGTLHLDISGNLQYTRGGYGFFLDYRTFRADRNLINLGSASDCELVWCKLIYYR